MEYEIDYIDGKLREDGMEFSIDYLMEVYCGNIENDELKQKMDDIIIELDKAIARIKKWNI